MTTTNAHAVELINGMIADVEAKIAFTNSSLAQALQELERRTAQTQLELEQVLNITDEGGLASSVAKVQRYISERASLYTQLRTLKHVVKPAAFGNE